MSKVEWHESKWWGVRVGCVFLATGAIGIGLCHGSAIGDRAYRAGGRGTDIATGREYLALVRDNLVAIEGSMGNIEVAMSQVVANARKICPGSARNAPIGIQTLQVRISIGGELGVIAAHVDARLEERFSDSVGRLQWHDERIASLITRAVRAAIMQSHLREPQLCASLGEWAHDGFQRVPPTLAKFTAQDESLSETSDLLPIALIYDEHDVDVREVREVEQLERVVGQVLRLCILKNETEIFDVVGLRKASPAAPVE